MEAVMMACLPILVLRYQDPQSTLMSVCRVHNPIGSHPHLNVMLLPVLLLHSKPSSTVRVNPLSQVRRHSLSDSEYRNKPS